MPWYRRPAAWGAAAALLLAAVVALPLLDRSGDLTTAGGAGGDEAAQGAATDAGGAGQVPLLRLPGEVTAATIQTRLASDRRARAALDAAAAGRPATPGAPTGSQAEGQAGEPYRSSPPGPEAGSANLAACLPAAAADADPATRPLTPAFYVEGTYQGRKATILVTASGGQPGRVDLWVFPRDNCSVPPVATERVR